MKKVDDDFSIVLQKRLALKNNGDNFSDDDDQEVLARSRVELVEGELRSELQKINGEIEERKRLEEEKTMSFFRDDGEIQRELIRVCVRFRCFNSHLVIG